MGRGMAKNLLDKGHEVVAFDTSAEALKEAVGNGAKEATSPKVFTHIIDFTKPFKNMLLRFVIQWTSLNKQGFTTLVVVKGDREHKFISNQDVNLKKSRPPMQ